MPSHVKLKVGVFLGVEIFVIVEILIFAYAFFIKNVVLAEMEFSKSYETMVGSVDFVQQVGHPVSTLLWRMAEHKLLDIETVPRFALLLSRVVDLLFWTALSLGGLYLKGPPRQGNR